MLGIEDDDKFLMFYLVSALVPLGGSPSKGVPFSVTGWVTLSGRAKCRGEHATSAAPPSPHFSTLFFVFYDLTRRSHFIFRSPF